MSSFAVRRRIFTPKAEDFGPVPMALDSWDAWTDEADASVVIVLLGRPRDPAITTQVQGRGPHSTLAPAATGGVL